MTASRKLGHPYPHFLIVGMMKCGTTTIYEHLSRHPKVVPAVEKELHYFTRDFVGRVPMVGWELEYHEMLGWSDDLPDGMLTGEASPSYIVAANRIHAFNPDTKIIIILRDPVRRALSQIRQHESKGFRLKEGGYLNHLKASPDPWEVDVVMDSNYLPRIQRFIETFPPDQIAVVSFEEFTKDPQNLMNALFAFLGLETTEIDAQFVGAATKTDRPDTEAEIEAFLSELFAGQNGKLREVLVQAGVNMLPKSSDWFDKY